MLNGKNSPSAGFDHLNLLRPGEVNVLGMDDLWEPLPIQPEPAVGVREVRLTPDLTLVYEGGEAGSPQGRLTAEEANADALLAVATNLGPAILAEVAEGLIKHG